MNRNLKLFDNISRKETRPKKNAEPIFRYYNTSARRPIAAIRNLMESWFCVFPEDAKADVRGRFRSDIDWQHQGAFFELYLHELVRSMGFEAVPHPDIPGNINSHPDFLLYRDGQPCFYLEGTITHEPEDQIVAEARANRVYDTLNNMNTPNFFLAIRVHGAPATSPPGAKIRAELERWLPTHDPDELAEILKSDGLEALPQYDWSSEGWSISFFPIPKSPSKRGQPGARPIGMTLPGKWEIQKTHESIRGAVISKAKKYGILDLPLIVAVNVTHELADEIDIMNGLFGEEAMTLHYSSDDRSFGRKPNGAFLGPKGPRRKQVSAVLAMSRMVPWTILEKTPELYHHPWAYHKIPVEAWELPQRVANLADEKLDFWPGKGADEILKVPRPWPVEDRKTWRKIKRFLLRIWRKCWCWA